MKHICINKSRKERERERERERVCVWRCILDGKKGAEGGRERVSAFCKTFAEFNSTGRYGTWWEEKVAVSVEFVLRTEDVK